MGNNLDRYLKDPNLNKFKTQFSKIELYMLALLFKDLSARHHGVIDKETFLQFFPLTGLWGERLFEKFDLKHTTHIDFLEFVQGIATCCHSTEDEKIHLLFSLYDMDQDGFIKKKEMITMLYNYPKTHIKFITDEIAPDLGEKLMPLTETKRQSINNLDGEACDNNLIPMSALSGRPRNGSIQSVHSDNVAGALNDELIVAEEDIVLSTLPIERDIKQSFAYLTKKEKEALEAFSKNLDSPSNQRTRSNRKDPSLRIEIPSSVPKKNSGQGTLAPLEVPMESADRKYSTDKEKVPSKTTANELIPNSGLVLRKGRRSSTSTIIMDQSFVLSTTVNTRVKEYASFMFKTFEGANSRGKISYDEFKQWLSMHPVILKVFDDTFHQDIWSTQTNPFDRVEVSSPFEETEREKLSPTRTTGPQSSNGDKNGMLFKYRQKHVEFAGYMVKKGKRSKSWIKRYYELSEHFLFYYDNKGDKLPKGILFLEGCYIEETKDFNTTGKYGFGITHKSDSYEPHYFYCTNKKEFDEWMSHLKLFQSSTVMDLYAFKEKIGTGKFSVVYRAITKDDKQNEYAVKVIEKKSLKPEEKEFLLSETSVMKILDHPSMIKLIDTIETKTHIYIVTEIVKDGDLFDYIITREYLEEYVASFIMKQLLISIYYLHNLGIVHRDIKPENILITLGNNDEIKELKIIDFGFARLFNEGISLTETCGTPNYVAPEVLRGCGYDKRADIWSLGVIMYLMVRGLLPFDDHDVNVILKNTLRGEIPLDDEHWRNVSPECKDLITKFLNKNPSERIDIKDALKHPWIKDREKLKRYEGANKRREGDF